MQNDLEDARIDHAFASGMKLALQMASQGADEKARLRSEQLMAESRKVLLANKSGEVKKENVR